MTEQEFYQQMRAELDKAAADDGQLSRLLEKIQSGNADLDDSAAYWRRFSELIGKVLSRNVTTPGTGLNEFAGYQLMKDGYTDINKIMAVIQKTLDQQQNIHIRPQTAKFPAERARKVAHSLEDATVSQEVIERRARNAAANVANSFHDDYIRENADFRRNAGLTCHVTRRGASKCCAWCAEVAGQFEVGSEPADFWRRHDNCTCQISYENYKVRQQLTGNGRGWKVDSQTRRRIAQRIQYKPTRFTPEQARELEAQKLSQYKGLTVPGKNDTEYSLFRRIEYNEANPVTAQRAMEFNLYQVTNSRNNIYVSEGARTDHIKPKELHKIDMHLSEVYKMMGIERNKNLPTVYVVNEMEMSSYAAASYNAVLNVLYLNRRFAIYQSDSIPNGMEQFACYKDDRSSYVHELYHWFDAEKYRKRYGNITEINNSDYNAFINNEAKKKLDILQKKGYNIDGISRYALDEYEKGEYCETYTEYRVTNLLKR